MNEETVDIQREVLFFQPQHQKLRLDAFLREFYKVNSRTYFQGLIQDGLVLVNGKPVKKSYRPVVDDEIDVQLALTKELDLLPEDIPLDIIYEDEEMLAVNKPAGMCVHPGHGNTSGTFANALLFYCKKLNLDLDTGDPLRPGIVHRLDKDTSGVLLAAKTARMHQALARLFASRQMEKSYCALCIGKVPEKGTIHAPIGRHPVYRKEMAVLQEGGKEAISHYTRLHENNGFSFVRVAIETGRTHQIRVHLKHLGYPILGDSMYGREAVNKQHGIDRQLLHCRALRFVHPLTRQPVEIIAPLPQDMCEMLTKLRIPYAGSVTASEQGKCFG